ncbi:protease SohB [Aestuariibacter sp. AA17]|uniref:Protease SohB n=1 Tax=Fluctibacter corallii TaxID=2984329 RepID=A0ABT3AAJ7_9ALTE|nr:protease SohB [Aestuariibacter sp. AA17]MCV2885346.1 protease SohB [Aestuariibacter sp. AA17]
MEFLYEYGLFIAKAVTIVVAILVTIGGIVALASKQGPEGKGALKITSMSNQLDDIKHEIESEIFDKDELKKRHKARKKAEKNKQSDTTKPNLFVIDFKGSMDAREVEGLRQEVTAILNVAAKEDEVLIRLESPGGVVHGYGLAASQLQRFRDADIPLTIAVDKVAASGGYMMACVGNKILSSKFAIIGSIGVLAQLPNFNKLLKRNDIEFEQHTAGQFKRTLTMFGENNDAGREKFREELEEVHTMFKQFISDNRNGLDVDKVATGEYWYGSQALDLGLVDEIKTSDDYLLKANQDKQIFLVKYALKKNFAEKVGIAASTAIDSVFAKVWNSIQFTK